MARGSQSSFRRGDQTANEVPGGKLVLIQPFSRSGTSRMSSEGQEILVDGVSKREYA